MGQDIGQSKNTPDRGEHGRRKPQGIQYRYSPAIKIIDTHTPGPVGPRSQTFSIYDRRFVVKFLSGDTLCFNFCILAPGGVCVCAQFSIRLTNRVLLIIADQSKGSGTRDHSKQGNKQIAGRRKKQWGMHVCN